MSRHHLNEGDVLCYSLARKNQGTVRRFYLRWPANQGLPLRCDNGNCALHVPNPQWQGADLPLILDHVDGNRLHNRPENLRLLCPNCESQLPTRGGRNKGRVQNVTERGFEIAHRDGRRDASVFPAGVAAPTGVGNVSASTNDNSRKDPSLRVPKAAARKRRGASTRV